MVQRFGNQHFSGDFFTTLRFEGEVFDCEVQGEVPRDIRGTFYRLGGDWLYPPRSPLDAPFSADGFISMFRFSSGRVDYRGRFVRTPRYEANRAAGRQLFGIYRNRRGDDPSVRALNGTVANTTPVVHAGRLFATKEDSRPYEIDPHTLETRGEWDFYGKYRSLTFTAHPKIDPVSGELICFGYEATGEASRDVYVYTIDRTGHVTREVRLQAPYVSEMHDMAITRHHIVIPMFPLTTDKEWLEAGNIHWYWDDRISLRSTARWRRQGCTLDQRTAACDGPHAQCLHRRGPFDHRWSRIGRQSISVFPPAQRCSLDSSNRNVDHSPLDVGPQIQTRRLG